ncbi:hypothetical protein C8J56DRAFT_1012646 [Mycena floridula]|nr:hypothetical protein C8J56DRAFT_1012646 [Mycena floridula]
MAYVSVEADERLEEGPEGLQFKSFLGAEPAQPNSPGRNPGVGNADRGYLQDQPHRKAASGFWTVEYYQSYFDVDTTTVLKRCYSTTIPPFTNFISMHLNPPDLYGPFWTQTTLIFTLFLSSSLAASISAYLSSPGTEYDYDFHLLSLAVSIVYAYGMGIPLLLWVFLRYIGVGEWSVVEALSLWGYSMFVWIPVSVLCVIPIDIVRWVLVLVAVALSGAFLAVNIYPILASAEAKATRLIIIVLAVLHAGIALTFKVLFFNYSIKGVEGGLFSGGGNSTVTTSLTSTMSAEATSTMSGAPSAT